MGDKTGIAWTQATWNAIRGCSPVSTGCKNCYAARLAASPRMSGPGKPYEGLAVMGPNGPQWTGRILLSPKHLHDPIRWREPRRIFVNSMSDLFHENLHDVVIDEVVGVMLRAPQHTYQVLTKRPERMAAYTRKRWPPGHPWPRHIWWGTSIENQKWADKRMPWLLRVPGNRFVSAEPLLEAVDISPYLRSPQDIAEDGEDFNPGPGPGTTDDDASPVGWVIVGGESGPDHRPFDPDWARSLRDQCRAARVPFFYKQEGGRWPGGRALLDGVEYHEFPEGG